MDFVVNEFELITIESGSCWTGSTISSHLIEHAINVDPF